MGTYPAAVERHMKALYGSLSEKDRRRYAAVEAEKLGHGGTQYVADLFQCNPDTIRLGAKGDILLQWVVSLAFGNRYTER